MSNILEIPPTPDKYQRMVRFLHDFNMLKELAILKYPGIYIKAQNSITKLNETKKMLLEESYTQDVKEIIKAAEEMNKEMLMVSISISLSPTKDEDRLNKDFIILNNLLFKIENLMARYGALYLVSEDKLSNPEIYGFIKKTVMDDAELLQYDLELKCGFR